MFFIFSKLLYIFILPFTWFFAAFTASLIVKKQPLRKRLLIAAFVILVIFSNPFLLNFFAEHWAIEPVPLKNKTYSCAIVLGGFSSEGPDGEGVFNSSADRFIQALKLYTTGKVSHLLISGGRGTLTPGAFIESDWVKIQLQQFKVPDSCILIENRSRNTLENAAFSKVILSRSRLQPPYILVTSAFHMRRSLGIFEKEKIAVVPLSCNYMTAGSGLVPEQFIPDVSSLEEWNIYIKELVGVAVNHLR